MIIVRNRLQISVYKGTCLPRARLHLHRLLNPKWSRGSGKRSNPRTLLNKFFDSIIPSMRTLKPHFAARSQFSSVIKTDLNLNLAYCQAQFHQ